MLVCDAREISLQARQARRFHAARLARATPDELDERSSFTQARAASIVACRSCGLLVRDPLPQAESVQRIYEDDEVPESRLDEMRDSQIALFRRKLPWLRRLVGTPRRVLEVGSFVGGFLEVARHAGWRVTGIDPGRQVAEACRARGLDVRRCTLEEFERAGDPEPIDVLAVWNTFDQLVEPRNVLAFASRWLRQGGVLALRVPHGVCFRRFWPRVHARSLPARRFAEACLAWNNLLGFPYLHGYGIESLDRLIAPYGFERVSAQGDVLGVLSGRATADWARREERACKQLQRWWIAVDARRSGSRLSAAPWLDVCFRRIPGGIRATANGV